LLGRADDADGTLHTRSFTYVRRQVARSTSRRAIESGPASKENKRPINKGSRAHVGYVGIDNNDGLEAAYDSAFVARRPGARADRRRRHAFSRLRRRPWVRRSN
jgi:hypothetical protein